MRESLAMALDIRYVRSGGVSVAYQVVGEGDQDLVFVPDFCSNLVYAWESPYWRPFYERLARSFRLIIFDKRGTGLSDRGGGVPDARDADGGLARRHGCGRLGSGCGLRIA